MVAAGARPGDMLHVAFGYGLFTGGLGFHDGAERIGMTVVPVSSGNTARHHLLLQDFRPAGICGHAVLRAAHRREPAEQGGDPRALGLRYGMFGAEPWTEGMRAAARARVRLPRVRHLRALARSSGPAWPASARRATGLHVADDHFLPEIVDPATGAPCCRPGREGRARAHHAHQARACP